MSQYFPSLKPSQPSTRLGGRPRGSRNKAGESVRWSLVEAYRQLGGVEGLVAWGKQPENRGEFYKLLVKVLPTELAESGFGSDHRIQVIITPASSPPQVLHSTEKPLEHEAGGLVPQAGVALREPDV